MTPERNEQMSEVPNDLLYTSEHDWLRVEDGVGVAGITDYAQSELGDVVFLELPDVGRRIRQGEAYGTVEAVKTVADLYAPVSGTVAEVNITLDADAGRVNADPYGSGWILKVEIEDRAELEQLLTPDAYSELLQD